VLRVLRGGVQKELLILRTAAIIFGISVKRPLQLNYPAAFAASMPESLLRNSGWLIQLCQPTSLSLPRTGQTLMIICLLAPGLHRVIKSLRWME